MSRMHAVAVVLMAAIAVPSMTLAGHDGACGSPGEVQVPGQEVADELVLHCVDAIVEGSITVLPGASLDVRSATLTFSGGDGLELIFNKGAEVHIEDAVLSAESGTGFSIRAESGSKLSILAATITGHEGVSLGGAVQVMGLMVHDIGGAGIAVPGGVLDAQGLSVSDATTGIHVSQGGSARLVQPAFDGVTTGILVENGSTTIAEGGTWQAQRALHATGSAQAIVRNATFGATEGAVLQANGVHEPHVAFASVVSPHDIVEAGVLEVAWYARIHVQEDPNAPGAPVGDANVVLQRGEARIDALVGAGDLTPAVLVPAVTVTADGVQDDGPWRAAAAAGRNATHATFVADRDRTALQEALQLLLPLDDDSDPPAWSADPGLATDHPSDYSNDGRVTLQWQAADDTVGGDKPNRAVATYHVLADGDPVATVQGTQAHLAGLAEGTHDLTVRARDLAGNTGPAIGPVTVTVDLTLPTLALDTSSPPAPGGAHNESFQLTMTAEDAATGVQHIRYLIGPAGPFSSYVGTPIPLEDDGVHNLTVHVADGAGNTLEQTRTYIIDRSAPVIDARFTPTPRDWFPAPPTLVLGATDVGPAGVQEIRYSLDGTEWSTYQAPVSVGSEGEQTVIVEAIDRADNRAVQQFRLRIDETAPELDVQVDGASLAGGWVTSNITLTAAASDATSSVEALEHRTGQGAWSSLDGPLILSHDGAHVVTVRATDAAGNQAQEVLEFRIDGSAPAPGAASFIPLPDGTTRVLWQEPPFDAFSGIDTTVVERRAGDGTILRVAAIDAVEGGLLDTGSGTQQLRIRVEDAAGNTASTPWQTVSLTVGEPLLDGTGDPVPVRHVRTLAYDPSGVQPAEVRFYIDDHLAHATAAAPYQFDWNTRDHVDGTHVVRIAAIMADGSVDEQVLVFEVRNTFGAVLSDHVVPLSAAVIAGVAATVLAIVALRRWILHTRLDAQTDGHRHLNDPDEMDRIARRLRFHRAMNFAVAIFGALVVAFALAWPAAPVATLTLVMAWWLLAAAAAVAAVAPVLSIIVLHQRPVDVAAPASGSTRRIDFDAPWKEGSE